MVYDPEKLKPDLKAWVDGEHLFEITPKTSSTFLHSSEFGEDDLRHALIYARNRIDEAKTSLIQAAHLGDRAYQGRIDVDTVTAFWEKWEAKGLGKGTLGAWAWEGTDGEEELYTRTWQRDSTLFRRTIAALCRWRVLMEHDDAILRRQILVEQDEGKGPDKQYPLL